MTALLGLLQRGLAQHQAGDLAAAEALYRQALALAPRHPDALHLLGLVAHQTGDHATAVTLIGKAIAANKRVPEFHSNLGEAHRALGRLPEAVACYRQALKLRPSYPEALSNLGLALEALGKPADAIARYQEALRQRPDYVQARNNLGNCLLGQGRSAEALEQYRLALGHDPRQADTHYNLGTLLQQQGAAAEALDHLETAHRLDPASARIVNNLGNALQSLGRLDDAIRLFERALRGHPGSAELRNNLGIALQSQGRMAEAETRFAEALRLQPDHPQALGNLASTLLALGRQEEAMATYRRALALAPALPDLLHNFGLALQDRGQQAESLRQFDHVIRCAPDHAQAHFARCLAELSVIYRSEAEIAASRQRYRDRLEALAGSVAAWLGAGRDLGACVGFMQPFLLAYQGGEDRALQARYGALVCRIMAEQAPLPALSPAPGPGEPVRVGVVCGCICDHTVWKLFKGWFRELDRSRFRLFAYHTGFRQDAETTEAAGWFERFVAGPLSEAGWRAAIAADRPHVLIWPELGMNAMSAKLAAQRLAPVQCNSWGHPDTSGYPTLDYFLSSALMEPEGAEAHYTETLVRLPNLSIHYQPLARSPRTYDRAEFGLRAGAVLYWCCQSLYKYLPQYDAVFPAIAAQVPDCQFVFIEYPKGSHINTVFEDRLTRAFAAAGLDSRDHCRFLPRLDLDRFVTVSGLCDVFLDSIGWSGGNTTLESLLCDLPIVTLPGPLMRSRHSAAILRRMGIAETIAGSVEDYVTIASRLGLDAAWRAELRQRIAAAKPAVYRDRDSIAALEAFLEAAARGEPVPYSSRLLSQ